MRGTGRALTLGLAVVLAGACSALLPLGNSNPVVGDGPGTTDGGTDIDGPRVRDLATDPGDGSMPEQAVAREGGSTDQVLSDQASTPDQHATPDQPLTPDQSVTPDQNVTPDQSVPTGKLTHIWSGSFGNTWAEEAWGMAADKAGNTYLAGYFWYTVDFGGGPVTSAGKTDAYCASYSASGAYRSSHQYGASLEDAGTAIAVDGSGNTYLAGYFQGTADFGGGTRSSVGKRDIFIASFDASGAHRFSTSFGDMGDDYGLALAVDGSGNVYLAGTFRGTVDFGGGPLSSSSKNDDDIYVLGLTSAGAHRFSRRLGGSDVDSVQALAVDAGGNLYVTGYFYSSATFGGSPMTSAGQADIFLAGFTSVGAHRWSTRFGGAASDVGSALVVDSAGFIHLTGRTEGTVSFGGTTLTSKGQADVVLASFDPGTGAHRWSTSFGSAQYDSGRGLAADSFGNIYVTGGLQGPVNLGGGTLPNAGSTDVFVASFTSGGTHRFSKSFGSSGPEFGSAVRVVGLDLYLAGSFAGPLSFGGQTLTNGAPSSDVFLVRFGL